MRITDLVPAGPGASAVGDARPVGSNRPPTRGTGGTVAASPIPEMRVVSSRYSSVAVEGQVLRVATARTGGRLSGVGRSSEPRLLAAASPGCRRAGGVVIDGVLEVVSSVGRSVRRDGSASLCAVVA